MVEVDAADVAGVLAALSERLGPRVDERPWPPARSW